MKRLSIALVGLLAAANATIGQEPAGPKVQVLSLEIRNPVPAGVGPGVGQDFNLGTRIGLLGSMPDKFVVAVEGKVVSCIDDLGADLMKAKKVGKFGSDGLQGFSGIVEISKDGKHFSNEFRAPGVASAGATRIRLKGTFVVFCGKNEKTTELKGVVFNEKLDTKLGPFVLKYAKQLFGDKGVPTFITDQSSKRIKSVQFLTGDGKDLKAEQAGRSSENLFGKTTIEEYYEVTDLTKPCTVRLTYFDDVETVKVPVDVQVGVGF